MPKPRVTATKNPPKPNPSFKVDKFDDKFNCPQPGVKDVGTTIDFIDTFSSNTDGFVALNAASLPNVSASCKGFETYQFKSAFIKYSSPI